MVTTWPWLRTRHASLEPSSPTSGGGQFGSPKKSRGMSGLLTSCLPLPLSSRQSACGRVASFAPLLLAAVSGIVYAGLVAQPYVRRAAGRLDTVQLAMGDSAQREQAAQLVEHHLTVLGVLARDVRAVFFIPFLQAFVAVCAFLSSLVAADRMFHVYIALYWRLLSRKKPIDKWAHAELPPSDGVTADNVQAFPKIVVQLPMFNEKEVCQNIIDRACELEWPRSRIMVQVLDDSTCEETRRRIEDSVFEWKEKGVNIVYRWRSNRHGYKAGAMHEAMADIEEYEMCAIFDADFDPSPDFLYKTIPYLRSNPKAGFVQARWVYTNGSESTLTRVQEISLNYHIRCEQYARFAAGLFFNFNGTAGVWRRQCIVDAGGWNNRTTVEDMDLSLRAYLRGWKFIFLDDVTCMNEIPADYDAYRKQQHRWSCGPMQLWRKAMAAVWSSDIPLAKKLYLNVFFFGTRMFATHIVSFFLYCILIPLCATAPEVTIPFWALVYAPILVTLSTVCFTPNGWAVAIPYVLYENAMCIVKVTAMMAGLLEWSNAHEWVVTTKLGKWVANKVEKVGQSKVGQVAGAVKAAVVQRVPKVARKVYRREVLMGVFFIACGTYGVAVHAMWQYSVFLCMQGGVFLAFGLNYVDGN